jgi:hypothetical protein
MTDKPPQRRRPKPDGREDPKPAPRRPYALLLPVAGGRQRPPGKPIDITKKPPQP